MCVCDEFCFLVYVRSSNTSVVNGTYVMLNYYCLRILQIFLMNTFGDQIVCWNESNSTFALIVNLLKFKYIYFPLLLFAVGCMPCTFTPPIFF